MKQIINQVQLSVFMCLWVFLCYWCCQRSEDRLWYYYMWVKWSVWILVTMFLMIFIICRNISAWIDVVLCTIIFSYNLKWQNQSYDDGLQTKKEETRITLIWHTLLVQIKVDLHLLRQISLLTWYMCSC